MTSTQQTQACRLLKLAQSQLQVLQQLLQQLLQLPRPPLTLQQPTTLLLSLPKQR
jgi:hypothetical protein